MVVNECLNSEVGQTRPGTADSSVPSFLGSKMELIVAPVSKGC